LLLLLNKLPLIFLIIVRAIRTALVIEVYGDITRQAIVFLITKILIGTWIVLDMSLNQGIVVVENTSELMRLRTFARS
jgi:hypothetical protein